ncbi:MAG: IgGFc-binding protein [Myxococcales bacterium]|nr:IgGFc-binding protein [Myxococcales bacterium]
MTQAACVPACIAAENNRSSVGCEYYSVFMDSFVGEQACFVAIIANTSELPAQIDVSYEGDTIDLAEFARVPVGSGPGLTLEPFDPVAGLQPSEAAIVFLSGLPGDSGPRCRVPSAIPTGAQVHAKSGFGSAFRITSSVPVVAYQVNPFGGASAAVTGASLLLPTSAWDTTYMALSAPTAFAGDLGPMLNIVAEEDDTEVELRFRSGSTSGGNGVPPGEPGAPSVFTLHRGQQAQVLALSDMTGNALLASKPVGLFVGAPCFNLPLDTAACDHVEQMLPPASSFASEAVAVMPKRANEEGTYRIVALTDGTTFEYSTPVGGPEELDAGRHTVFSTDEPFVVRSQDDEHPFMLIAHMTGGEWAGLSGLGDPEMVLSVPPIQFLDRYVFFADPTYSESTLVVVRAKEDGIWKPVTLDCLGEIDSWEPVGDYQWARVDLTTGDFESVAGCSSGRRVMESEAPFGLWVWGWATPEFSPPGYASYGYPAGMNVRKVNDAPVQEIPE